MSPDAFLDMPNGTSVSVRGTLMGQVGPHARNIDIAGHLIRVGSGEVDRETPATLRRVRFKAANSDEVWTVIAEHAGSVWMHRGGEPVTARCSWVEDVLSEEAAA